MSCVSDGRGLCHTAASESEDPTMSWVRRCEVPDKRLPVSRASVQVERKFASWMLTIQV